MSYLGNEPLIGKYDKIDDISSSFNGSTTNFSLTVQGVPYSPAKEEQMMISIGGIWQEPKVSYNVSNNTIVFSEAPASGLNFFGIALGDTFNATINDTKKNNDNASVNPSSTDDSNSGYTVGSRWINIVTRRVFFATDVTPGAARWQTMDSGKGNPIQSIQFNRVY